MHSYNSKSAKQLLFQKQTNKRDEWAKALLKIPSAAYLHLQHSEHFLTVWSKMIILIHSKGISRANNQTRSSNVV